MTSVNNAQKSIEKMLNIFWKETNSKLNKHTSAFNERISSIQIESCFNSTKQLEVISDFSSVLKVEASSQNETPRDYITKVDNYAKNTWNRFKKFDHTNKTKLPFLKRTSKKNQYLLKSKLNFVTVMRFNEIAKGDKKRSQNRTFYSNSLNYKDTL